MVTLESCTCVSELSMHKLVKTKTDSFPFVSSFKRLRQELPLLTLFITQFTGDYNVGGKKATAALITHSLL